MMHYYYYGNRRVKVKVKMTILQEVGCCKAVYCDVVMVIRSKGWY